MGSASTMNSTTTHSNHLGGSPGFVMRNGQLARWSTLGTQGYYHSQWHFAHLSVSKPTRSGPGPSGWLFGVPLPNLHDLFNGHGHVWAIGGMGHNMKLPHFQSPHSIFPRNGLDQWFGNQIHLVTVEVVIALFVLYHGHIACWQDHGWFSTC